MKPLRVRLHFEDRRILKKEQRKLGLRRSWLLLRPEFDTIAALASYIVQSFHLRDSCPNGLLLSMDQFVLPPFESTEIFKDEDVILIKKREFPQMETLKFSGDGNYIKESGIVVEEPLLLCDREEFMNESGGYESEDVENEVGSSSDGKTGAKRKRNSSRTSKSKAKKRKKTSIVEIPRVSSQSPGKIISEVPPEEENAIKVPLLKEQKIIMQKDTTSTSKRKQKEGTESLPNEANAADKKIPSRSARRKKAKRQWLRELKNSEKKEPDRSDKQESPINDEDEDVSCDDEFIPVVVKPGHIRFGSSAQDKQSSSLPVERLQWNGTVSKKKGQKWGREEGSMEREDALVDELNEVVVEKENKNPNFSAIFEELPLLRREIKVGNIIAYKLVELSSSWCPELSSFRVGKVASFDPISSKIILDQVPDHPISFRERTEEDELLPDVCLYKDDGSLEIDFPSLHDVRLFDSGNITNREMESAWRSDHEPSPAKNNAPERQPENTWDELTRALEQKKEELSQNGWPSLDKNQSTKTRKPAWPIRAMRRSAIGPTISFLRSNNAI